MSVDHVETQISIAMKDIPACYRPRLSTAQKIKFSKGYEAVKTIQDYMDFLESLDPIDASQNFRFANSGWPDREGKFATVARLPIEDGYFESVVLPNSQPRESVSLGWKKDILAGQQPSDSIEYNMSDMVRLIEEQFGLEEIFPQLSNQRSGVVHGFHFDDLKTYYVQQWVKQDPDRKNWKFNRDTLWADMEDRFPIKVMIPLADWHYGQMFQLGMKFWDNWHAGDMVVFDWQNLPHSTANASFYDRPMARISAIARYSDPRHDIFRT